MIECHVHQASATEHALRHRPLLFRWLSFSHARWWLENHFLPLFLDFFFFLSGRLPCGFPLGPCTGITYSLSAWRRLFSLPCYLFLTFFLGLDFFVAPGDGTLRVASRCAFTFSMFATRSIRSSIWFLGMSASSATACTFLS